MRPSPPCTCTAIGTGSSAPATCNGGCAARDRVTAASDRSRRLLVGTGRGQGRAQGRTPRTRNQRGRASRRSVFADAGQAQGDRHRSGRRRSGSRKGSSAPGGRTIRCRADRRPANRIEGRRCRGGRLSAAERVQVRLHRRACTASGTRPASRTCIEAAKAARPVDGAGDDRRLREQQILTRSWRRHLRGHESAKSRRLADDR